MLPLRYSSTVSNAALPQVEKYWFCAVAAPGAGEIVVGVVGRDAVGAARRRGVAARQGVPADAAAERRQRHGVRRRRQRLHVEVEVAAGAVPSGHAEVVRPRRQHLRELRLRSGAGVVVAGQPRRHEAGVAREIQDGVELRREGVGVNRVDCPSVKRKKTSGAPRLALQGELKVELARPLKPVSTCGWP